MESIYIIGSGAIGKALAVVLKNENRNVSIIRGSIDNLPGANESFSITTIDNQIHKADIPVKTLSAYDHLNGIVVLTNKSFGNQSLADKLKDKINASPIIILQNGLDIEQPFLDQNFPQIYRCVLFATSQQISPNNMRFRPVSESVTGIIKGNSATLEHITDLIHTSIFPFKSVDNIHPVIWIKTIINSVFNSICPLLNADNGIFHRNEEVLIIARRMVKESVAIAREYDIHLKEEYLIQKLLQISRASDGQLISTLQDLNANRPTEIETLNFAISNKAMKIKRKNTVKETTLLGELIKIKSQLSTHVSS